MTSLFSFDSEEEPPWRWREASVQPAIAFFRWVLDEKVFAMSLMVNSVLIFVLGVRFENFDLLYQHISVTAHIFICPRGGRSSGLHRDT